MFALCNRIAYNGIMVNGVQRNTDDPDSPDPFGKNNLPNPLIAPSHWADEPANTPGTHLQPNQIERLKKVLDYLRIRGIEKSAILSTKPPIWGSVRH
jgi:hypothetical protein